MGQVLLNARNVKINFSQFINYTNIAKNSSSIIARYTSYGPFTLSGSQITQWNDIGPNATKYHITSSYFRGINTTQTTITQGSNGLIGNKSINVVNGDNTSGFYFPFSLTNASYTFCYVARYTGNSTNITYNRRIFDVRDDSPPTVRNYSWGFSGNAVGKSYNQTSGWYTTTESKCSEPQFWLIGINTEISARFNGVDCTNNYVNYNAGTATNYPIRPGYNPVISVNFGTNSGQTNSNETSNWQILEMIFYNTELTLIQQQQVENYLSVKYGHISFTNNINSLNMLQNYLSTQLTLYDKYFNIYNGYYWAYNINTNLFMGPGPIGSTLYVSNSKYFWIVAYLNQNTNTLGKSGSYNNYKKIYTFLSPQSIFPYKLHMICNGGGAGGGGGNPGTGGGAGGQSYVYNLNLPPNINFILTVGSRGGNGTYNGGNNGGAGGDSIINFSYNSIQYTMSGNGGNEGIANSFGTVLGGSNVIISGFGTSGGNNGGNSLAYNQSAGGAAGGAIPIITNLVTLYTGVTLWNVIQLYGVNSTNSTNPFTSQIWGNGGCGARIAIPSDQNRRDGTAGGYGFIMMIIDSN